MCFDGVLLFFGFWVKGKFFQVIIFEYRVTFIGLWVTFIGFWVINFGFRVIFCEFRVTILGFLVTFWG